MLLASSEVFWGLWNVFNINKSLFYTAKVEQKLVFINQQKRVIGCNAQHSKNIMLM